MSCITDIVRKIVGPIRPVGETNEDNERFENLKVMCKLIEGLLNDVERVGYDYRNAHEFSKKRASTHAQKFIAEMAEVLKDTAE